MKLFTLDSLYRRAYVIDKFESLVWTERWQQWGDFELYIPGTTLNRGYFQPGTHLAMDQSDRVMVVETIEASDHSGSGDVENVLRVVGRSLESILTRRVYKDANEVGSDTVLEGTPGDIAREMFDDICRTGTLSLDDKIPFLLSGSLYSPNGIAEPSESIRRNQSPQELYEAIRSICYTYDLGMRLYRRDSPANLYFEIYTGDDRTTGQETLNPVIFSHRMDNLVNVRELYSVYNYANVAYVFSPDGNTVVYSPEVDPTVSGFDRRAIVVNTIVDPDAPVVADELERAGEQALLNAKKASVIEGEAVPTGTDGYFYGIDYHLGDLVEIRGRYGDVSYKRVTEQIFTENENGFQSYPSFSRGALDANVTWQSFGSDDTDWQEMTTEVWEDY